MLKRNQVEQKVLQRIAQDPDFRQRLKSNPRAALEAEFKIALSPTVNIALHEDEPDTLHIVLPPDDQPVRSAPISGCDRQPAFRFAGRL